MPKNTRPADAETPGVVKGTSFAQVPAWVARHPGVTDRAVRLYAVLGSIGPVAFAGWEHLAGLCGGCSVSTIGRAMKSLTDAGALKITPQFRADGLRRTNEYELAFDKPFPLVAPLGQICDSGPVKSDRAAQSDLTVQDVEKCELEKSDLEKPSHDPSDRAVDDPPKLTLVEPEKPRNAPNDLARRYWDWFTGQNGGVRPLQVFVSIQALFKRCLESGWEEPELVRVAAATPSPFTLRDLQRTRDTMRGARKLPTRPTDPTAAAMADGSFGMGSFAPEPGKSTIVSGDDILRERLGGNYGKA